MKRITVLLVVLGALFSLQSASAESEAIKQKLKDLAAVEGAYTFALIGDNRSGDRIYQKIVQRALARKPRFAVNTGDLIPHPGDRDQWRNFWKLSKPVDIPYFLTPGNHDIDDKESEEVWRDEVDLPGNETYYSFTVGNDLFVVLNSCEPGYDRRIDGAQLKWLRRTLEAGKYRHKFVFLHHPLFVPHGVKYEGETLDRYPELRDRLHRLFVEKGVTAVFVGHVHAFHRMEKDGLAYIITGGAGAPLYGKGSYNHIMIIHVKGPRLEAKVIDKEGIMRDEFLIRP